MQIEHISTYLRMDKSKNEIHSYASFSGYGFSILCEQFASSTKLKTFTDIENVFGGILRFNITQDELADRDYFDKWINLKDLFLVMYENNFWNESYNPDCASAKSDQIEVPKKCSPSFYRRCCNNRF